MRLIRRHISHQIYFSKRSGYDLNKQYIATAASAAIYYGTMINTENAELVKKVAALWGGANGLYCLASPSGAVDFWGIKGADAGTNVGLKWLGAWSLASSISLWALIQGTDTLEAIGQGWAAVLFMAVSSKFISKEVEKLGMDETKAYVWMAMAAAVVGTLAL